MDRISNKEKLRHYLNHVTSHISMENKKKYFYKKIAYLLKFKLRFSFSFKFQIFDHSN